MTDSEDSDDDFQLYTRTGEDFIKKRNQIQAKRREFENVIDLLSEDDVENALNVEGFENRPSLIYEKSPKKLNPSVSITSVGDFSDSDDLPLAELSRKLKRCKRSLRSSPQKRPKRSSRKMKNKEPSSSQASNHNVIVLDDDTGYEMDSLPPIEFNCRSRKKSRFSDEVLGNISLENIINEDPEEDELIENDDLVTLTIEWNNSQKTTRKEFKIRRYQKFETVFEELANMEKISTNYILLLYHNKAVRPTDTPSSLNLTCYGALEGSISPVEINHNKVNFGHEDNTENTSGPTPGIQVKLLLQSKQTLLFRVLKRQKMDILYSMCAEELKCEKNKLKLTFDGEYVEPNELVADLDIEDGDVFHVHVKMS